MSRKSGLHRDHASASTKKSGPPDQPAGRLCFYLFNSG